ncbi:MAG: hypothetical protein BroJett030_23890 [Alphaproteobacteria bacterium]|nr:MAG: hypothetical protein BroJett030_23890 [Alphaproteobacteria bacterium]
MSAGRVLGFGLLGWLLGAVAGGVAGLGGGLGWITLAGTSGFEGYSGYVVAYWMLGGILVGMAAGAILGTRFARR